MKGDILTVLRKDEDEWWFAQHEDGRRGSIPVPYIQIVSEKCKLNHSLFVSVQYATIFLKQPYN